MCESILAVDSLAIQRSLTILEDRYRELREIGARRHEAWEKENTDLKQQLAAQSETLQQIKEARDEQAARAQVVEGELATLKSERDDALGNVREAREEAELTLLQLHQVQEELEHYFLSSRSSDQLVEAQAEQNPRAVALIGRMLRLQALPG